MLHPNYPTSADVDAWCEGILDASARRAVDVRPVNAPQYTYQLGIRHIAGTRYLAFQTPERTFYGYWQPASAGPAPVLFHLPGYGAEMSAHPELVVEGFNVLHINPLGYCTPEGASDPERKWTVMQDTVTSRGARGYVEWLSDAAIAVQWALGQDVVERSRFGFFGSSQGGGTALLLGSIFSHRGTRAVAADVPYLTGFAFMRHQTDPAAYRTAFDVMTAPDGHPEEWRALGFVDTMNHVHRLAMPVLLTAGSEDGVTPPVSIEPLFAALPGTRSYTYLHGQGHTYTMPFLRLAAAWFRLHV